MTEKFKALWATAPKNDSSNFKDIQCEIRQTELTELTEGNVVLKAKASGINYKDALAVTGQGKILRRLPLVPGIDVAGVVMQSKDPNFKEGDEVICNGSNLGEHYCGGYSEVLRVPGDILLQKPKGLSFTEAMTLGTAGFTAALAIHQLELNGLRPEKGEVLVTGASGGVGSIALGFLNHLGYETVAWTRRQEHTPWIEACGAARVEDIEGKDWKTRPLESVVYSSAIDNVGGEILQYIIPRIDLWGSVASIGLARSEKLSTTVFPFILRGVNILGVSSNNCPPTLRQELWQKMADEMKPKNLDHIISKKIGLTEVPEQCQEIVAGRHLGRVVVQF